MYLQINNLYKQFNTPSGSVLALKDINMQIQKGEFICAVGASGSGKSTLLRMIAGLDIPSSGEVLVDDIKVTGPGADRGMVFQHYSLYPWMSVADNVGFGLKLRGENKIKQQQQIAFYLDVVGLSQFAKAFPKELSGGMKQRVAIARALASEPKILLMDEPFGALDIQTKEVLHDFLREVWQRTRTTIFMITHDVEEAVFLAQRIYVLSSRPGTVEREITIDLPLERDYHSKRLSSFQDYRETIMDILRYKQPSMIAA